MCVEYISSHKDASLFKPTLKVHKFIVIELGLCYHLHPT